MKKLLVLFVFTLVLSPAFAVVYTTKNSAENLALVLDKGRFKGFLIKTTFVLNNRNGYYVAVTLSNGKTYRWYIDDVFRYNRQNDLKLRKNKAIIFDPKDISKFVIFDKNQFHRTALTGDIFKQIYNNGDILEGLTLFYKIKEFYFLDPKRKVGKDENGYPYSYRIDLLNGNTYYFSVDQAYRLYLNQQILRNTALNLNALGESYEIKSMIPFEKPTDRPGINEFGVELKFDLSKSGDEEILLNEDQFPVEIYEKTFPEANGLESKYFVVDVLLPNTVFIPNKSFLVNGLEYLEKVELAKTSDKNISVLRGKFNDVNYNFFEIPPTVSKTGKDTIFVTFFHNLDQTLPPYDDKSLASNEDKEQSLQKRDSVIKAPKNFLVNTPFGRAYKEAFEYVNAVRSDIFNINSTISQYEKGIQLFEKAGYLATNDTEFKKALDGRNRTRSRIYALGVEYIDITMQKVQTPGSELTDLIKKLHRYTQSPRESNYLVQLESRILARQARNEN